MMNTRKFERRGLRGIVLGVTCCLAAAVVLAGPQQARALSYAQVIAQTQPKMVKIYGAGGFRGLEAYQSGFLISDEGHVLTVWSYVLDTNFITVTLDSGRKYQAKLVGMDPRLEIAVLKIDAAQTPHFKLEEAVELQPGAAVLAFSNLYGVATGNEPASVQYGVVSAKTKLTARRGAFKTPYRGEVYVIDAMTNNPGAAGGALTDRKGRLAGILGKELRNAQNSTWLNYSIPAAELTQAVADIRAGKIRPAATEDETVQKSDDPVTLAMLGVVLVPEVIPKTPPFIDRVVRGSPADRAGLKPDDLILFVNNRVVRSCKLLRGELSTIDRDREVRLTVQRDQELLEVVLRAEP